MIAVSAHARAIGAGTLLSLALLAGCVTTKQKEDDLAAAGFLVRPASTPDRQAMLKRLPPNKIVQRQQGGDVTYVYADPAGCNCLYVGTQQNYANYRGIRVQKQIAEENEMAALDYTDAAWNWDAWGPWDPAFGFGPGPGW